MRARADDRVGLPAGQAGTGAAAQPGGQGGGGAGVQPGEPGLWRELRQHQMVERLGRVGHWFLPAGSRRLRWSREAARIHGLEGAPSKVGLDTLLARYVAADARRLARCLGQAGRRCRSFDFEAELRLPGGVRRTVRMVGECERCPDGTGQPAGMLVVVKDISEHRAALAALAAAEARQADFAETASDWLWETGPDHRFVYVSDQVEASAGLAAADHIGKTRRDLIGHDRITPDMEVHFAALRRREPFRDFRFWRIGGDGRQRYISVSGKPLFGAGGRFLGYRGSGRDMTSEQAAKEQLIEANRQLVEAQRQTGEALADLQRLNMLLAERNAEMARAQAEMRYAALHDPLTGLPNRRYLDERLPRMVEASSARNGLLGVLQIDLDRFKQINDTLGYAAGDAVLKHVAAVLSRSVAPGDFVARVGGDEFVVVCAGREDERALERLAHQLAEDFARPFPHRGRDCWFGAKIGVAAMRGGAADAAELLVNADIALYRAKSHGRDRCQLFSTDLQSEIMRHKALADGVLGGIKRGEFVPYYQPQFCAGTHRIVGVEALARWRHPAEGLLSPGTFLQVIDDLGIVASLDRTILESAVADLRRWQASGVVVPKLSVNVSARRLLERDLIEGLARMDLPRSGLAFELLESVFLDEMDETVAWNVDMLKEMGIEVELDDFGSGHASIVSLVKLGPDAIKIDRELIGSVTSDRTRCGLVRSIVEIGRSLGTRVIAEGVETRDQADLLRDLGCDALQGFYFGGALSADEFQGFARRWQALPTPAAARQAG